MLYRCYYAQKEHGRPGPGHELGRALLKAALLRERGIDFYEDTLSFTELGKPYFAGLPNTHFSISHTDGLVACVLDGRPVGVDAERFRPFERRVARRVCAPGELERAPALGADEYFMRLWTLKESYVKATGQGFSQPFSELEFRFTPQGVRSNLPGFRFTLYEDRGFVMALCRTEP